MKRPLLSIAIASALACNIAVAQHEHTATNGTDPHQAPGRNCATVIPSEEWDTWFNQLVEKYTQDHALSKTAQSYTVPVIVHIIHSGEAVGSGTNISQAQVNSQITVLNNDYAGTGLNVGNCPAAFTSVLSNTGIHWCAALKDPNGNTLAEPGIERIHYNTISGLGAPGSSGYSTTDVDGTIKPLTIWNPTKYCNIWVLKLGGGLLGYATFPGGTGLSGLFGSGTTQDDGVVIGYNYFGSTGTLSAPYNKGRTATHELGHWLGLRHINGDMNCGNDFCTDTPKQEALLDRL